MRIAICDDEDEVCARLSQRVQAYRGEEMQPLELDCFSSGEALLAVEQDYDIVFLDIYMDGITGMDVARVLSQREHCQIVFITTSREHAIEAFSVKAIHYLVKPLAEGSVEEALDRCLSGKSGKSAKIIELKNSQGTVPIPLRSIVYVEVINKISNVHTLRGVIRVYTTLDAICGLLDDSFLRVQRSFAVNMHFIESFLFDRVVLQGGLEITLSRNNRAGLKTNYQQFLFRLARGDEI